MADKPSVCVSALPDQLDRTAIFLTTVTTRQPQLNDGRHTTDQLNPHETVCFWCIDSGLRRLQRPFSLSLPIFSGQHAISHSPNGHFVVVARHAAAC